MYCIEVANFDNRDEFKNNGLYTASKDKNGNWNVSRTKLSSAKYDQLRA